MYGIIYGIIYGRKINNRFRKLERIVHDMFQKLSSRHIFNLNIIVVT